MNTNEVNKNGNLRHQDRPAQIAGAFVTNQICVKIIIYKGCNDGEVIHYCNKLPMWIIEQWRWYFEYVAALVKVHNPRRKVELITCAQTLKQGQEYAEEKAKNMIRFREARIKKLENEQVPPSLFGLEEEDRKKELAKRKKELDALKRGEYDFWIPPTYINRIKMDKTMNRSMQLELRMDYGVTREMACVMCHLSIECPRCCEKCRAEGRNGPCYGQVCSQPTRDTEGKRWEAGCISCASTAPTCGGSCRRSTGKGGTKRLHPVVPSKGSK